MIHIIGLIGLAIAPIIYLTVILYGRDKFEPEPKRILLIAFLWGCFSIIPAIILEAIGVGLGYDISEHFILTAIHSFIVVALSEEICKFVMLRFHAYRHQEFNEPFDGIVYAAFVSLGFACVENLGYVLQNGFTVGILRMFTSVPAHFSFGVIMGYYVGKAKFNSEKRLQYMTKGILYATLFHGAYDFFIMQKNEPALAIFTLVILIVGWRMSKKAILELQSDSKFRMQKSKNTNE